MTAEQIIEREWRDMVGDTTSPVHVELEDEEIRVWYRCIMYVCDCQDDEDFIFFQNGDDNYTAIVFSIPQDYYNLGESK